MMNKVRILLVDDHPMVRHGLREAIERQSHFTIVGEAKRGSEGLTLAQELTPDLVVMDIHLPDMNGLTLARQTMAALPAIKIIIFSSEAGRRFVSEAMEAGVCGYLWKTSAVEELIQAIDMVMAGKLYFSPEISGGILEDYRQSLVAGSQLAKPLLSERDKELLRLIAEGCRNKEIASKLSISTKSVETYRSRLSKKLGYSSAAELVRYAIREGIAEP